MGIGSLQLQLIGWLAGRIILDSIIFAPLHFNQLRSLALHGTWLLLVNTPYDYKYGLVHNTDRDFEIDSAQKPKTVAHQPKLENV